MTNILIVLEALNAVLIDSSKIFSIFYEMYEAYLKI